MLGLLEAIRIIPVEKAVITLMAQPIPSDPNENSDTDLTPEREPLDLGWPPLRWRGDGQKRALTCGTLLHIVGTLAGAADTGTPDPPHGIAVRDVVRELRRRTLKYNPNENRRISHDAEIKGGDGIHTADIDVIAVLAKLIQVSRVITLIPSDTDTDTRLELTPDGQSRLEVLTSMAREDPRYDDIDLNTDPILEYNPILDLELGNSLDQQELMAVRAQLLQERLADELLPKRRPSTRRLNYRQWVEIARHRPLAVVHAVTGISAHVVLTDENTAVGAEYEHALIVMTQIMSIADYMDLFLAGGPEGLWSKKDSIKPQDVHHDVTVFTSGGHHSFVRGEDGQDILRQSSTAWELFERDRATADDYARITGDLRARLLDLDMTVEFGSRDGVFRRAQQQYMSAPILPLERNLAYGERGERGFAEAGKFVQRTVGEALAASLGLRVESPDGRNGSGTRGIMELGKLDGPGGLPRVRCTHVYTEGRARGSPCTAWALGTTTSCELHGGQKLSDQELASLARASLVDLVGGRKRAVETIMYLMEFSPLHSVRLRAAETLLNRAGMPERAEVDITTTTVTSEGQAPSEIIRSRLRNLAGHNAPRELEPAAEPIDADVVDDVEDGAE